MKGIHENEDVTDNQSRTEQAEARTEQAEARTELAKTRTEQAETRSEQAETRTELAKARTELAEVRSEQAEIRSEQAESRTELAKTRTEEAEIRSEQAETRSEEAIRVSELSYRRLFEAAKEGILILESDTGRISDVNPFLTGLLGFSHGELVGTRIWELGPFKDLVANKAKFEQLQQQGYVLSENLALETKDGRKIAVEFVSNVYLAGDHNVLQCNVRDITERKRAEEELRWKTAFLEAQIESALDGILVVDNQGKKILQNQRMNDLWKIPPQIAEDKDDGAQVLFVTSRAKSPQEFADKVAYLYSHPDEVSRDEIELIDGTFLDRYSSPVRDRAGKHYGRIWTFRDITERRKLEAQFRQSQKMDGIGQLAGGVAHDFNNILAVIQIQAELMRESGGLSAKQLDYAKEIGDAAQRAAALTRQLLLFSRKEALQLGDLDLNQSINNTTQMLRRILGEDIQIQFKFSMESLLIHADAGMMDQVLMNLAVNSRDAMPTGGRLVIETSIAEFTEPAGQQSPQTRAGSFVCLSVSDTGCGIPAENLARIFEPFFTTKDIGKGTGLGLATVFGIVQQHQGWINVYSEVDHGTTFRIYLPRLAGTAQPKPEPPTLAAMRGGDETVLLVEDEPFLHASMCKILAPLGYRVLEAFNGVEALKLWKKHRDDIHLLLTDLVMPGGMTGKELAKQLLEQNPKLKVVYTSGYSAGIASKDFQLEEGVNFLTKPFEARKLAQIVRERLDTAA
ncbi:MAG TPA: PAS domain S-box protein [Candidatus Acidoferrales bacterium]|jgi:two-component system cell cycle sensor histidine kinase/response regulator CckA|nr:PAS domain S-box protein [Candidatus Acidoferrales bacterium]